MPEGGQALEFTQSSVIGSNCARWKDALANGLVIDGVPAYGLFQLRGLEGCHPMTAGLKLPP
jgi:hypothetical protein